MAVPAQRRPASPIWPAALNAITDAYLRVSEASPTLLSPAAETSALLFIDLDGSADEVEQLLRAVREVPAGFLTQATHVLARIPPDGPAGHARVAYRQELAVTLQQNLRRRGIGPDAVGVVDFPIAAAPVVVWSAWHRDPKAVEDELLARARQVELAALLGTSRAIWEPTAYHYQLPSGLHSARYIRTGDAIQRPRDAEVVASWLHRHVRDRLGVVLDGASTISVAIALGAAAQLAGFRLGPVVSLDDYPNTQFEVLSAVTRAAGSGRALALISVSSSGGTRDRLLSALSERDRGVVEVLVDRQGHAATRLDDLGHGWIGLLEAASEQDGCRLCVDPARSLVVPIDPKSFEPHAVPEPTLMLPDIGDAADNRSLMELYDMADCVGLECEPHPATQKFRPSGNLAFRFYPHQLLDPERGCTDEVDARLRKRFDDGAIANQFRDAPTEFGALLVLAADQQSAGFDRLLGTVEDRLPFARSHKRIVIGDDLDVAQLEADLDGVDELLVLTVGSMSGVTLSDANVLVQDHCNARLWALALHARPSAAREWETLRNSYSGNLAGAWVTLMPDRSVFREEAIALRFAQGLTEPKGDEAAFVERRISRATSGPAAWHRRIHEYEVGVRNRRRTEDSSSTGPLRPVRRVLGHAPARKTAKGSCAAP